MQRVAQTRQMGGRTTGKMEKRVVENSKKGNSIGIEKIRKNLGNVWLRFIRPAIRNLHKNSRYCIGHEV